MPYKRKPDSGSQRAFAQRSSDRRRNPDSVLAPPTEVGLNRLASWLRAGVGVAEALQAA